MKSVGDVPISVALVTRNRIASLERALRSWRRQSVQPLEIVVSDDSDPQYASDIQTLALRYNAAYVRGPRAGLYANRNNVVECCSGSHILSADDDHEHPIDYLARIQAAIRQEPSTIWCMGESHSWHELQDENRWYRPGQLSPYGSLWPAPLDPSQPCWAISDGATLYPRQVFDSGFRFYDRVKFGCSYAEFGSLLFVAGWRIRVLTTTAVVHHTEESGRSYNDRIADETARYFAMFMFSFYYQPSLKNIAISTSRVAQLIVQHPVHAWRILDGALRFCRTRSTQVHSWIQANGKATTSMQRIGRCVLAGFAFVLYRSSQIN